MRTAQDSLTSIEDDYNKRIDNAKKSLATLNEQLDQVLKSATLNKNDNNKITKIKSQITKASDNLSKCGVWRWSVKTLTDNAGIDWLSYKPVPTTIRLDMKQLEPR